MKNSKKSFRSESAKQHARALFCKRGGRCEGSIKRIAQHFGVSYEWARRVVTGVRYAY